ncbi:hypothetical protein I7I53_11831 [Histoplasma capsulatum var. duboisii H88]|uniref:Uncharacterized protein n=1 Tax=Ajellomyces capsulatus (strain H88) TaxID=544711 RepID=A0A8A1LU13_AJEC8|nr:hypothetical protein I7I53_11831 [Histoplasma capsulatum var. duboisii H88]
MVVYLGYSIVSFEPGKHSTDSFHFWKRTQSRPSFVFHGKNLAYLKDGGSVVRSSSQDLFPYRRV